MKILLDFGGLTKTIDIEDNKDIIEIPLVFNDGLNIIEDGISKTAIFCKAIFKRAGIEINKLPIYKCSDVVKKQ